MSDNIPYTAVMVDLETMGIGPNAAIVAIGAVKFWLNVKQDDFTDDQLFFTAIDLESSVARGLTFDAKTIKWWMAQSDVARGGLANGIPLEDALTNLAAFFPSNTTYIFGNGATFDNVILRNAFNAAGIPYPVSYKYDVCYRTLCKISNCVFPPFVGTPHNALDDAKMQTHHLMDILEQHPWVAI